MPIAPPVERSLPLVAETVDMGDGPQQSPQVMNPVVLFPLIVPGLFLAAAWSAGSEESQVAAFTTAFFGMLGVLVLVVLANYSAGVQCDDSCGGSSWQETAGAWQWHAQLWVALAAFACAFLTLTLIFLEQRRVGQAAAVFTAATLVGGWVVLALA